ncbi:hypothetical protein ACFL5O_07240 [Myxococcota bacterium]
MENTTSEPIAVDINVTSGSGVRAVRPGKSLAVQAHAKIDQSVAVNRLGVQLVGKSASLFITASYQGADGVQRVVPLSAWVEHESGFATARVRDQEHESRANAALGFAGLTKRRLIEGRWLESSGRATRLDVGRDERIGVVSHIPELPDPTQHREPNAIQETSDIPDAERTEALTTSGDESFDKGGNYTVCFKPAYWYVDGPFGEDYLIGHSSSSVGHEPARYMFAALTDSAGNLGYWDYLNAAGCTRYAVNHPNGEYTGWITTALYQPASDIGFNLWADTTQTWVWYYHGYTISGSGGTVTLDQWTNTDTVLAATISTANTLYRSTSGYANGLRTNIYVHDDCPSIPFSACTIGNTVYLGVNKHYEYKAWYKNLVAHELGHRSMDGLFGLLMADYAIDTFEPLCRCDHVTVSNETHCLQSRHNISTVQREGWAQAFAATNVNNPSHNDCVFAYYKDFLEYAGVPAISPPVPRSCYAMTRWLNAHCSASASGTEHDWMNFYWQLRNKQSYSYGDFKSLYTQACGGSCSFREVTWLTLESAANTVFGSSSPKANALRNQGLNYGVWH